MSTLLVDITTKCNLRCSHCYNSQYFTLKDSFNFNKLLTVINNNSFNRIHILGGEPLMSPSTFKLIDHLSDKEIKVSINTNGLLMDEEFRKKMLKTNVVDQITISLDGHDAESNDVIRGDGVFNKAINNVKEFRAKKSLNKIKLNLAFVATPSNILSIRFLAKRAFENGFNCILLSFLYYEGNAKKDKKDYDFELLTQEISCLITQCDELNIALIIDAKPIFLALLKLYSNKKLVFENNESPSGCYAIDGNIYMSAFNRVYPCGPSSFYGNKYELNYENSLKEQVNFTPQQCFKNCIFIDICNPCPLNIECSSLELCDYALDTINKMYGKIKNKRFIKNKKYKFYFYSGYCYLINFHSNELIKLFQTDKNSFDYNMTIDEVRIKYIKKNDERREFILNILDINNRNLVEIV